MLPVHSCSSSLFFNPYLVFSARSFLVRWSHDESVSSRGLRHIPDWLRSPWTVWIIDFNNLFAVRAEERHHYVDALLVRDQSDELALVQGDLVTVGLTAGKLSFYHFPDFDLSDLTRLLLSTSKGEQDVRRTRWVGRDYPGCEQSEAEGNSDFQQTPPRMHRFILIAHRTQNSVNRRPKNNS